MRVNKVNEAFVGRPAEPLRPFIDYYSGYRQAGVEPAVHRGLPSPYLTVIFTLHEPLVIAEHPDPRQPASVHVTLAGGLHTTPALVTHDGSQSGIQLAVSPLGARALLGVPAGELAVIDVEGTDVLGPLADRVAGRLLAERNWKERFAVLDEVLCERLSDFDGVVSPEVSYSWQRLLAAGGAVRVSALAEETGWSDRHLRSVFRTEIGLTPKAAARVIRFHRARRVLQRRVVAGRALDLAGLAADCGYYDQAHLDLEFRSLSGVPPTAWVAEEFRNFQALGEAGAAGLEA
jgi:AraC-like DNA-binding protein